MLRPGEVSIGGNPAHTMRLGHVRMQRDGMTVTVPTSKTPHVSITVTLVARPDIAGCPVRAMADYLRLRPAGVSSDFLFISDGGRPLTARRLSVLLKRAGSIAGIAEAALSGHCFRIGGASHGARLGMSEVQLREAGRWRSSAVNRYLRRPVSLLAISGRS